MYSHLFFGVHNNGPDFFQHMGGYPDIFCIPVYYGAPVFKTIQCSVIFDKHTGLIEDLKGPVMNLFQSSSVRILRLSPELRCLPA